MGEYKTGMVVKLNDGGYVKLTRHVPGRNDMWFTLSVKNERWINLSRVIAEVDIKEVVNQE